MKFLYLLFSLIKYLAISKPKNPLLANIMKLRNVERWALNLECLKTFGRAVFLFLNVHSMG